VSIFGATSHSRWLASDTDRERIRLLVFLALGCLYALHAIFAHNRSLPVLCPFRRLTGLRCPLCGCTTALGNLMHGQIREAFRAHPLAPIARAVAGVWYVRQVLSVTSTMHMRSFEEEHHSWQQEL
jgi:hypothetical protein